MNSMLLSIGKVTVRINGLSDRLYNDAGMRYSHFIKKQAETEDVTVNLTLLRKFISSRPLEPEISSDNGFLSLKRYDFDGTYDKKGCSLEISMFENVYSLDAVLRIIYSYFMVLNKGFLIHSAGIVMDDEAYVFCGQTLHGKSHIVKTTRGGTLLSDEITLIRKIDGKYYVFGTPFWGEFAIGGVNRGFPLEQLFFLHTGEKNAVKEISSIRVVQKLLSTILLFINDKKINDIIFDTITEIVNSVSCYKVVYNQKDDIWREIKYDSNAKQIKPGQ